MTPGQEHNLANVWRLFWKLFAEPIIITHWSALAEGNMQGTEASPSLYFLQTKQLLQLQAAKVKL